MAQLIPHLTSTMLSSQPDQASNIINRLIDYVNELQRQGK